jgi:hypothetical protein
MEFHRKWIAQCGEKLLDFAEAARCRVDFARELPNF